MHFCASRNRGQLHILFIGHVNGRNTSATVQTEPCPPPLMLLQPQVFQATGERTLGKINFLYVK